MDGLFALGVRPARYQLPHPRLGLAVILLVHQVLLRAFQLLRTNIGSLESLKEDEVTLALCAVLENDLRQNGSVPGFNRQIFESVYRQGQAVNYNFTSIGKTPDLCFRLRNDEEELLPLLSEHNALFVECKPVDKGHAAGGHYCDRGLCRFVDGDYAWAMQEGMMVGYVRHQRSIARHLLPAIRTLERQERLNVLDDPQPIDQPDTSDLSSQVAESLHVSRHHREFSWPDDKGPATEILVYHSWHDCS